MKKCKRCGKDFETKKGLINYCSMSCRNSNKMTEERRKKISDGVNRHIKENGMYTFTKESYEKMVNTKRERFKKKLLNEDFDTLSWDRLRKRILFEQDEKCNKCGLSMWFDKKLSLEIDHIDGDNKNNKRDNLEALCPNCHSITPTWRGRNKKCKKYKVNDEDLFNSLIRHNWNMRQSLLKVGLAPKGGNYKRCHRLKNEYENL